MKLSLVGRDGVLGIATMLWAARCGLRVAEGVPGLFSKGKAAGAAASVV